MRTKKKYFFKYKNLFKYKKHLLKFNSIGFKIIFSKIILKKEEEYLKLYIIKIFKSEFKKKIKIWFFFNCYYNLTKLPIESRMGKGKGEIIDTFGFYKKGFILFEINNIFIYEALNLKKKLNKKNILKFKIIF
uniref:Ribosomal protein L16 n=1 Tax=Choreocolax polysiphoniae TaxID=282351 RepID=A0A1J0F7C6_9FLOR|nr:ribosomal protein L16 [Choreocolax polysiphoniae]APC24870.1 ribosomal protein L16 [Choreocolax polysiphoniae]